MSSMARRVVGRQIAVSGTSSRMGRALSADSHFNSPVGPQTARMQVTEVDSDGVPTYDMSWGPG
jgi:hypothetical protein